MKKIIIKILDKLFPNAPKMTCCGCLPERFVKCPYKPKKGEYNLYCYCYNMKNRECNDFVTYMMKLKEIAMEEDDDETMIDKGLRNILKEDKDENNRYKR